VLINYWLKSAPRGDVKLRVYDGARLLAEMDAPKNVGINTVRWTMQSRRERTPAETAQGGGGFGGGGGGGFGGGGQGQGGTPAFPTGGQGFVLSTVTPGEYDGVLTVGGREYRENVTINADHWFRK
jgi:hypothetical protein